MIDTGRGESVPLGVTSFVGRKRELSELRQLLAGHRVVTLVGPGGVGKTRLAVQLVGAGVGKRAPLGHTVMVDLTSVFEEELVPSAFAMGLGARPTTSLDPGEIGLAEEIGEQELALLLDNCEHLLAPSARILGTLLRRCRNVLVIATSREPLGVDGEAIYPVVPFAVPARAEDRTRTALAAFDCVELFLQRARAALPTFALTDENAADVAELCVRLEGIPLAVELAAVRLRALPPGELVLRLEDRFRLLSQGPRTADARQRTLRASMDWSHDLCGEGAPMMWAIWTFFWKPPGRTSVTTGTAHPGA